MSIEIKPIKKHIGATVHVERAELNKPEVTRRRSRKRSRIAACWYFRKINLTDEEQIAFTDSLGERINFNDRVARTHTTRGRTSPAHLQGHARPAGQSTTPNMCSAPSSGTWTACRCTTMPPPKATLLTARRLAAKGGQTQFASTAAAYEALPEEEKARIDNLRVVHSIYAAVLPTLDTEEEYAKHAAEQRSGASVRWSGRRAPGANR